MSDAPYIDVSDQLRLLGTAHVATSSVEAVHTTSTPLLQMWWPWNCARRGTRPSVLTVAWTAKACVG